MKKTVEEIYPVEEVAKEVLQNNKLPIEDDFAEGFIHGAILGAEWQKEQLVNNDMLFAKWILTTKEGVQAHNKLSELNDEECFKQLYELYKQSKTKS